MHQGWVPVGQVVETPVVVRIRPPDCLKGRVRGGVDRVCENVGCEGGLRGGGVIGWVGGLEWVR